jgi:hypothetical protein
MGMAEGIAAAGSSLLAAVAESWATAGVAVSMVGVSVRLSVASINALSVAGTVV